MKRIGTWTCIVLVLAAASPLAWAQAVGAPEAAKPPATQAATQAATRPASQPAAAGEAKGEAVAAPGDTVGRGLMVIGCCVGAAFAAAFGGMAIARIATACLESIARQPEAGGQLFSPMIITAAMVEGCILFAIVIALMGIMK
jgi:F-type H+-transporting ATPase subunit c